MKKIPLIFSCVGLICSCASVVFVVLTMQENQRTMEIIAETHENLNAAKVNDVERTQPEVVHRDRGIGIPPMPHGDLPPFDFANRKNAPEMLRRHEDAVEGVCDALKLLCPQSACYMTAWGLSVTNGPIGMWIEGHPPVINRPKRIRTVPNPNVQKQEPYSWNPNTWPPPRIPGSPLDIYNRFTPLPELPLRRTPMVMGKYGLPRPRQITDPLGTPIIGYRR